MEDVHQIERALLSYWRGNPEAADSLEGIARGWTPMAPRERVALALQRLVDQGLVAVSTKGRTAIYRLVQK